jgi:lysozyme family protein
MSDDLQTQASNFASLSRAQLRAISQDFHNPDDVQTAARNLIDQISDAQLAASVADFNAATPLFTDLTQQLVALTSLARKTPGGDTVATLSPIVRQAGDLMGAIADVPRDRLPAAGSDEGQDGLPAGGQTLAQDAPSPGTVNTSRKLADIAGEYSAMFAAAGIDDARSAVVDKLAKLLVSFRPTYEKLQADLTIPWYFVGLIHCMESNFNFGTHLHNGDSLMHRTANVPTGRPQAGIADPPFAWTTSATDALTLKGFQTQTDWSVPALLFRLEQYNGFGYRLRGRSSPYLWSFSDRYVRGKFVKDGVFDPDAVSKQCGAAVLLKRLIARGNVVILQ